ncbi:TetR/AcrR family transcriptional regulator C-terminal domain-containing protein [Kitasatospora sp. NBC_00240]|uniref:TetR/AcrR family transcriptional regulator C-terminal domain-containing protein n=1 Tax=Kitasatospora sp. NBC_00240 TaxID=2903567 RepID=UPI00224FADB7|nr:TetR/AcrR family transcriptional regulator C-terminal domain-containing protein [Kitasatospora sp. NBC_00240]MCX5208820.1 TetR/AcrR family transcriptional regulator C-terminal domain-containing protein [Kitasatospora sp. NBC_00240]
MPRETLTADRIIRAAIELLDEEGLDGLNMRSLGARLGSAATAIYWHVKTKDDLVRLAGDAIWQEVEISDLEATDWRTAATAQATGIHAMLTRHPWLGQAFGSHLLYGPGKARHDDHSLAVYETAGFAPADADRAATTVLVFVLGSALAPAAQVSLTRRLGRSGDAERQLADTVARSIEIAREFPRLRERLGTDAAVDYAATPGNSFEFGLQAILDGFEARLAAVHPAG